MQHSKSALEIIVIVKGRHRFRWEVQDHIGKVYAHGEAVTVALARAEAGSARLAVKAQVSRKAASVGEGRAAGRLPGQGSGVGVALVLTRTRLKRAELCHLLISTH
jgi:hypothetical protein